MSDDKEKIKHSQRLQKDQNAINRQIKIAKRYKNVSEEPHVYHKKHAMDCGTPGCIVCGNPRRNKILKNKDKLTIQERKFYQDVETVRQKHSNGVIIEETIQDPTQEKN